MSEEIIEPSYANRKLSFNRVVIYHNMYKAMDAYVYYALGILIPWVAYQMLRVFHGYQVHYLNDWVTNYSIAVTLNVVVVIALIYRWLTIPYPEVFAFPTKNFIEIRQFMHPDFSPVLKEVIAKTLDRAYKYVSLYEGEDYADQWANKSAKKIKYVFHQESFNYGFMYLSLENWKRDHAIMVVSFLTVLYRTMEDELADDVFGKRQPKFKDFMFRVCNIPELFNTLQANSYRLFDLPNLIYNRPIYINQDEVSIEKLEQVVSNKYSRENFRSWAMKARRFTTFNEKDSLFFTNTEFPRTVFITEAALIAYKIESEQFNIDEEFKDIWKEEYILDKRVYRFPDILNVDAKITAFPLTDKPINAGNDGVNIDSNVALESTKTANLIDKEKFDEWVDLKLLEHIPNSVDGWFYVEDEEKQRVILITKKALNEWVSDCENKHSLNDLISSNILLKAKFLVNEEYVAYGYRKSIKFHQESYPKVNRIEEVGSENVSNNQDNIVDKFIKYLSNNPANSDEKYFLYNPFQYKELTFITQKGLELFSISDDDIADLIKENILKIEEYFYKKDRIYAFEFECKNATDPYMKITKS